MLWGIHILQGILLYTEVLHVSYPNACFCGITTNRLRVVKLYLKGNTAFTNYWCILRCEANNGNYDDMPMLCREGDGER